MSSAALKGTGFYRLWVGESVSMVGSEITRFALPLIAVLTLAASPWQMGVLTACGSAAVLVFGLSAGVVADRFDRIRLMHLSNALRVLLVAAIPIAHWYGVLDIWLLAVISFLVAALTLMFDSCMSAYLPGIVERRLLPTANAWMQGSVSVGDTVGPSAAGVLVQVLGAPLTLLIDAASYVVSSLAIRRLPRRAAQETEAQEAESHFASIRAGFRIVFGNDVLRPTTLAATHYNLFQSMFLAIFLLYGVRELDLSTSQLGLIMTGAGLGGLVGATMAAPAVRLFGFGRALAFAYALPGLAALAFPLVQGTHWIIRVTAAAAAFFVWMVAIVVNIVLSDSLKQAWVPSAQLGRTTATIRFASWGVEPLGALCGGFLASTALGLRGTILVAAVGLVSSAFWLCGRRIRRLRTLDEGSANDGPQTDSDLASTSTNER